MLADKDLSIDAKGGLSIVSAEETSKTSSTRQEKKSGISVSYSSGNLSAGYLADLFLFGRFKRKDSPSA